MDTQGPQNSTLEQPTEFHLILDVIIAKQGRNIINMSALECILDAVEQDSAESVMRRLVAGTTVRQPEFP